jgi:hypothetical protein
VDWQSASLQQKNLSKTGGADQTDLPPKAILTVLTKTCIAAHKEGDSP